MPKNNLRIVFMGTPDFAVGSLKALVEKGYNIVGVITSPDKPAGRGRKVAESSVKKYAIEKGLNILQPEKLKNPVFIEELKELKADLQVVVAFRMLPEVVWDMPKLGTFNLHASLLPQYRGAAPLNWAIINGETETGVTTFLLDHKIDTGKILFSEKTYIGENETVGDIHARLMEIGATLVVKTVDALRAGNYEAQPQDKLFSSETELKHAPKIFKDDCRINWDKDVASIKNLVRGLSPYPVAWTNFKNQETRKKLQVKIYGSEKEITNHTNKVGEISSDNKTYLKIAATDGWVKIEELQVQGKKRMKTEEFLRGFQQIEKYSAK